MVHAGQVFARHLFEILHSVQITLPVEHFPFPGLAELYHFLGYGFDLFGYLEKGRQKYTRIFGTQTKQRLTN
jgi:hypothetical protein